jgi:Helix-turn-helix
MSTGGPGAGPHGMAPPGVGAVLRGKRLAAGLTQAELAERAGVSVRAISDLERGRRRSYRRTPPVRRADPLVRRVAPPGCSRPR